MSKNILVTGASTGIGYSITTHLAANGYHVFAGARKPEDIERLSSIDGVTAIKLEVTEQEDIDAAVALMQQNGGIYGLVNNAGIAGTASLLDTPLVMHSLLFDVNVFSHLALVRSFFEQLRENSGKIINISSISSLMGGGTYSATKRSVDAFTIQMANELDKFGIGAAIVNPGFFESAIFDTSRKRSEEFRENSEHYQQDYVEGRKSYDELKDANIKDPIMVAEKVAQLLSMDKLPIYNVVGNRNEETWSYDGLMGRIKQVNDGLNTPWTKGELLDKFQEILDKE